MTKFVLLSFVFLAWAFYEVSGGKDFEPAAPRRIAANVAVPAVATDALPDATIDGVTMNRPASDAAQVAAAVPVTRRKVSTVGTRTPKAAVTPAVVAGPQLVSLPTPTPQDEIVEISPSSANEAVLATVEQEAPADIRAVRGTRVNLRSGPGTGFGIVGKLVRDTRVEILRDPGSGWVKLKVEDTGRVGWMSARLLRAVN